MTHTARSFRLHDELAQITAKVADRVELQIAGLVEHAGESWPLSVLSMGSADPQAPAVAFVGGVHGLERIGSEVVLAFLRSLVARMDWDTSLQALLDRVHLLFMPAVNPVGLARMTRSNGRGVDLMRNAPHDASGKVPFLIGGQRYSAHLPWYRGAAGEAMEIESSTLCQMVREHLFGRPLAIAIDCHSGFGLRDRIWFPYARHHQPAPHLAEAFALRHLFNESYPQHSFYIMEPQSLIYSTHGDLWDHLYDEHLGTQNGIFLPFTLEMGSWTWVQKNPRQLFSLFGHFNPMLPHRLERVLRRHLTLFTFLIQAAAAAPRWCPTADIRRQYQQAALQRWYPAQAQNT